MKTLFLVRHAKSSWDDTALPDKDRPLNDRGKRDAAKMGQRLAKIDVKPDLILSSPARRALTTAEIVAKKLDYKLKNILVGDFCIEGLRPTEEPNEVLCRMSLDIDGILNVSAIEKETGKSKRITIARALQAKSLSEIAAARERLKALYSSRAEEAEDSSWRAAEDGIVLEGAEGDRIIELRAGTSCLVPRGTWHKQVVHTPGQELAITYGKGTKHRPA